jgi:hypothetical protein
MHDPQAGIAAAERFQEFACAIGRAIIDEVEIRTKREGNTALNQRQNVFALVIGGNDDDGSHCMTPFAISEGTNISGWSSEPLRPARHNGRKYTQPL